MENVHYFQRVSYPTSKGEYHDYLISRLTESCDLRYKFPTENPMKPTKTPGTKKFGVKITMTLSFMMIPMT